MSDLCERFEVSRTTGYKWLARFRAEGEAGLLDRSRRPLSSPSRTPETLERRLLRLRDQHPGWGGRKLRRLLSPDEDIPSASTVTEILRRNGRLDPKECGKHRPWQRFEESEPNRLWQMDFKGHFQLGQGGRCHPLGVLDDCSRFCLVLRACPNEQGATVQAALTDGFRAYGLPERILCDNGAPWGTAGAKCGYTALGVWLLRLNVEVCHGRPWHPQTQGKEERFHRTLLDELIRPTMGLTVTWNAGASLGKPGANPAQSGKVVTTPTCQECQEHFDRYRSTYNEVRPHLAIGLMTPASRYRPSPRPFPESLPPVEYPDEPGQLIRKVQRSGEVSLFNHMLFIGTAFANQNVALRPSPTDGVLDIYYCQQKIGLADLKTLTARRRHNHSSNMIEMDQV